MIALLASPLARAAALIALGAALLAAIWWHGYETAAGVCEADQLRGRLAAAQRDQQVAEAVAEGAKRRAAILDETLQANQDRIDAFEAELAKQPDGRCPVSGSIIRELHRLGR